MTVSADPIEIVEQYFARVRARDEGRGDLFEIEDGRIGTLTCFPASQ